MDVTSRRERKKAMTRNNLADTALKLFLERGYDAVGVREIADTADVSVTTLFKHFPGGKEALLFDEETDREAMLVGVIRDRPAGESILEALRRALRTRLAERRADPEFAAFLRLVDTTPALRDHARRMWLRHAAALAEAIASELGLPPDDAACLALAHFALETVGMVRGREDDAEAFDRVFQLLEHGWTATMER